MLQFSFGCGTVKTVKLSGIESFELKLFYTFVKQQKCFLFIPKQQNFSKLMLLHSDSSKTKGRLL